MSEPLRRQTAPRGKGEARRGGAYDSAARICGFGVRIDPGEVEQLNLGFVVVNDAGNARERGKLVRGDL